MIGNQWSDKEVRYLEDKNQTFLGSLKLKKSIDNMNYSESLEFKKEVQTIFQDPFEVYNPFYKVETLANRHTANLKNI